MTMGETDQVRTKKMTKEKSAAGSPLLREFFQLGVYKRSQGRIARQVTFAAVWLLLAIGAWRLGDYLQNNITTKVAVFAVPAALVLAGGWFAFRLVNMPTFADFLIAVEAEMNKVSWPTRRELFRSSVVVIFSIVFLAGVLAGYDAFWVLLLKWLGVRP